MDKQVPTREFLESQVKLFEEIILKNMGALAFCKAMLEKEIYVPTEKEVESNG